MPAAQCRTARRVVLRATPATLPGVAGRPMRASAVSTATETTAPCDTCTDNGTAQNIRLPTSVVPTTVSFFMKFSWLNRSSMDYVCPNGSARIDLAQGIRRRSDRCPKPILSDLRAGLARFSRRRLNHERVKVGVQRAADDRLIGQLLRGSVPRAPIHDSALKRIRDQPADFVALQGHELFFGIIFVELWAKIYGVYARVMTSRLRCGGASTIAKLAPTPYHRLSL